MNRVILPILAWAACTPFAPDEPMSALSVVSAPPPTIELTAQGPAVLGALLEVDIQLPVARSVGVFVPITDGGLGSGICPDALRGDCLDIIGDLNLEQVTTDSNGRVTLAYTVPATHATSLLSMQAVIPTSSRVFLSAPLVLPVFDACEDEELPYDGVDNDCDPSTADDDLDNDGLNLADDCDDEDEDLPSPQDRDCDGIVQSDDCDDADPDIGLPSAWFADQDGDGYGGGLVEVSACEGPANSVMRPGDCDDDHDDVYPGAEEHCDGLDNDCDATTTEFGLATFERDFFDPFSGRFGIEKETIRTPSGVTTEFEVGLRAFGVVVSEILRFCDGTHDVDIEMVGPGRIEGLSSGGIVLPNLTKSGGGPIVTVVSPARDAEIRDLIIRDGTGLFGAGGIFCDSSDLSMRGVVLSGHTSTNGAALMSRDCELTIEGTEIRENTSLSYGGAVHLDGGSVSFNNSTLSDNVVGPLRSIAGKGGAIFAENGAEITTTHTEFIGNMVYADEDAGIAMGGAVYLKDASMDCNDMLLFLSVFEDNQLNTQGVTSSGLPIGTPASMEYGSAVAFEGDATFTSFFCSFRGNDGHEFAEIGTCTRGSCVIDDHVDAVDVGTSSEWLVFDDRYVIWSGTCTAGVDQSGIVSIGGGSFSWDFTGLECN
jgi:hypothetical protein